jgi:hypothetical protein
MGEIERGERSSAYRRAAQVHQPGLAGVIRAQHRVGDQAIGHRRQRAVCLLRGHCQGWGRVAGRRQAQRHPQLAGGKKIAVRCVLLRLESFSGQQCGHQRYRRQRATCRVGSKGQFVCAESATAAIDRQRQPQPAVSRQRLPQAGIEGDGAGVGTGAQPRSGRVT